MHGTVFHRASPLPPFSPFSAVVLNHISSHLLSRFLTLLLFVQRPRSHFGHLTFIYYKVCSVTEVYDIPASADCVEEV